MGGKEKVVRGENRKLNGKIVQQLRSGLTVFMINKNVNKYVLAEIK